MHGVHRTAGSQRGNGGEQAGIGDAEAGFLAFHVAAALHGGDGLVGTQPGKQGVALLLEGHRADRKHQENHRHGREYRPALARIADHAAESEAERGRDQEDRQHLDEVGQRRRVLVGMRRVGVEEAAAVGAEHLDRFLRGDRTHGQGLGLRRGRLRHGIALVVLERLAGGIELGIVVFRDFQCRHVLVGVEILDGALTHQEHGKDQRERQQDLQRNAGQIDPGVADGGGRVADKAADQRDDDDDAGGGGEESSAPPAPASASGSSWWSRRYSLASWCW